MAVMLHITTGVLDYFTSLEEHSFDFHIELGDNSKYSPVGTRIVKFQREFDKALLVKDILYALGLQKNLISVFV